MKIVILVLVIVIFLSIVAYRLYQQRALLKKSQDYENLLRDARVTRYQYTQALQTTREILQEVERLEEKPKSLKAEIYNYHQEMRIQIEHLRKQRATSTNSELDKRTIAQMENDLAEKWAHTDARKKVCLEAENTCAEARQKLNAREEEELRITEKWTEQKNAVMTTYQQLKEEILVTDPMKYFS
ncbi:MAG: hypothetical protein FVQ81_06210 [Candidatus Glassbacteria bacterium]|nr:hypothetical protein [Candidatus Glassbacteria bacterium]